MALEEATDAKIPFFNEEVNLLSMEAVFFVVSLILGMTIWNMTDSIGENAAQWANRKIGDVIGTNPATGQSSETGGAFD